MAPSLIEKSLRRISWLNAQVGQWVSYLNLLIMGIVVWEVFCRYLLRSPTSWAMEINQYLLAALALLAGGYTLLEERHVRVDMLHRRLPPKARAAVEVFSGLLILLLCAVLLWHGSEFAWDALRKGKRSMSLLEFPLFPSMALVPLGAFLLGLQAAVKSCQGILVILGRGLDPIDTPSAH